MTPQHTVLLAAPDVEDPHLHTAAKALYRCGIEFFSVANAYALFDVYRNHQQEINLVVVLSDHLGDMTGKEIIAILKTFNPSVRIAFFSRSPMLDDSLILAGAVLHKLLNWNEFFPAIQELLAAG